MRRAGHTLIELLLALALIGALAAVALPPLARQSARYALHAASRHTEQLFREARHRAQTSGRRTAVLLDPPATVAIVQRGDTLVQQTLDRWRVTLAGTRDSMAYAPNGLAWGAANLRLILERDGLTDTLFISRLGRVRRALGP